MPRPVRPTLTHSPPLALTGLPFEVLLTAVALPPAVVSGLDLLSHTRIRVVEIARPLPQLFAVALSVASERSRPARLTAPRPLRLSAHTANLRRWHVRRGGARCSLQSRSHRMTGAAVITRRPEARRFILHLTEAFEGLRL